MSPRRPRPAVFLDRDGPLNREQSFVTRLDQLHPMPGAAEALRRLKGAGHGLAVVTNQSAIARGMLSPSGLAALHWHLHRQFGGVVDGWFHAPWHPEGGHGYGMAHPDRKPGAGLLHKAVHTLDLTLEGSVIIGDAARDLLAAADLPTTRILVRCGKSWEQQLATLERAGCLPHHIADDLPAATEWWLGHRAR